MRKILVTGGSGLIGMAIVQALTRNFKVYSIDRKDPDGDKSSTVKYITTDLTKENTFTIIKKINPEIIVHCAAVIPSTNNSDEEEIRNLNPLIDKNIISVASELGCYLIFTSSTTVYGYGNNQFQVSESEPLVAISLYGKQKIETESLIANQIKKFLILRINAPYGKKGVHKTVLNLFSELALHGKTLQYHGSGNRMQDFTNVDDIANLISSLLRKNEYMNGIFNISYGNPITMKDLAELIVNITGSKSLVQPSGLYDNQENYKASYSTEKAKNLLGWNPKIPLDQGILEIINNLKKC